MAAAMGDGSASKALQNHSGLGGGALLSIPKQDTIKHFPFLDLPREIRNQVYQELLCPYPEHQMSEDGYSLSFTNNIASLFHTAILYTNHQVHDEAREAMLLGNQFVRIITQGLIICGIFDKVPMHIVTTSRNDHGSPIARDCPGAVMSYFLRDEDGIRMQENFKTYYVLILGRDLDAFVRGVGNDLVDSPRLPACVNHSITIHAPFKKGNDPNYSNLAAQKRLLQPFRDHLHGFAHVEIGGEVDEQLAATVTREVRHENMPDPDGFIASITQIKEQGNMHYRDRRYDRALEQWQGACARITRLRLSVIWRKVHKKLGSDFVDALVETLFLLQINQVQAELAQMHEHCPCELNSMRCGLVAIGELAQCALCVAEEFESAWRPSARQEAKLCFRLAQAGRLAKNVPLAQSSIDRAEQLQPNDALIQQERAEIDRMILAEMGLL